ncbi:hypothetical protein [Pseudonocardia spinosispora]|uniref:hypothetical protein n=1 Tax=Pseudonocardia spinosispora TaxID=103441 RepID=UPI0004261437|nr:hypothetical protein [Pseudonocardia spinosispora]
MIHNVHQREFRATEARLSELLDEMGGPNDRLWPRGWTPMVLTQPLAVGSDGGHGDIRYRVTEYEPGRRVEFTFTPPTPLDGTHALEVLPGSRPDTAILRHVLMGTPVGVAGRLAWTLMIRWMHDCVLEELLDNAGAAVGDPPARQATRSTWVRLGRCALREGDTSRSPSQT